MSDKECALVTWRKLGLATLMRGGRLCWRSLIFSSKVLVNFFKDTVRIIDWFVMSTAMHKSIDFRCSARNIQQNLEVLIEDCRHLLAYVLLL